MIWYLHWITPICNVTVITLLYNIRQSITFRLHLHLSQWMYFDYILCHIMAAGMSLNVRLVDMECLLSCFVVSLHFSVFIFFFLHTINIPWYYIDHNAFSLYLFFTFDILWHLLVRYLYINNICIIATNKRLLSACRILLFYYDSKEEFNHGSKRNY